MTAATQVDTAGTPPTATTTGDRIVFRNARRRLPFTQIENVILKDTSLSLGARVTYGLLLGYARQEPGAVATKNRLSKDLGVGRRQVFNLLRELEACGRIDTDDRDVETIPGLITIEPRFDFAGDGHQLSNYYIIEELPPKYLVAVDPRGNTLPPPRGNTLPPPLETDFHGPMQPIATQEEEAFGLQAFDLSLKTPPSQPPIASADARDEMVVSSEPSNPQPGDKPPAKTRKPAAKGGAGKRRFSAAPSPPTEAQLRQELAERGFEPGAITDQALHAGLTAVRVALSERRRVTSPMSYALAVATPLVSVEADRLANARRLAQAGIAVVDLEEHCPHGVGSGQACGTCKAAGDAARAEIRSKIRSA